jgi:hypothetical protein
MNMSTEEPQVSIPVETQIPAAATTQLPAVVDQVSTDDDGAPKAADSTEEAVKEAPEKTPEQKERERDRRQLLKAQRNNARLYAENEQLRQYVPRQQPERQQIDPSTLDQETLHRVIQQEAERIAEHKIASETQAKATQRTIQSGSKEFGELEFNEATETFVQEIGGLNDRGGKLNPVVRAVLKMDDAHKVIKFLGDNPEIAAELPTLDPFDLGLKLASVRQEINAAKLQPRQVIRAPSPARPTNGSGVIGKRIEDMTHAEYRAHRIGQGAKFIR